MSIHNIHNASELPCQDQTVNTTHNQTQSPPRSEKTHCQKVLVQVLQCTNNGPKKYKSQTPISMKLCPWPVKWHQHKNTAHAKTLNPSLPSKRFHRHYWHHSLHICNLSNKILLKSRKRSPPRPENQPLCHTTKCQVYYCSHLKHLSVWHYVYVRFTPLLPDTSTTIQTCLTTISTSAIH